jgi:hypothetical protein
LANEKISGFLPSHRFISSHCKLKLALKSIQNVINARKVIFHGNQRVWISPFFSLKNTITATDIQFSLVPRSVQVKWNVNAFFRERMTFSRKEAKEKIYLLSKLLFQHRIYIKVKIWTANFQINEFLRFCLPIALFFTL